MKPKNVRAAFNQEIAGLIRAVLYAPDGKPPEGWTIRQDIRIAQYGTARWGVTDWEAAIRGLRLLYPEGKLTLRLFSAANCKAGQSLVQRAIAAYRQGQKRQPMAATVRDFLRGVA